MSASAPLDKSIVVFDLDGTLVDSGRDLIATLNRVIATEGLPAIADEHVGHLVGQGSLKMLVKAYEHYDRPLEDEVKKRLHQMFLESYEANIAVHTVPFDGVIETLEALKADGWILAVCTNKYEGMSKKLLKILNMDHYFAGICGSDTYPVRKPDPKHLWATIEDCGGAFNRAIMVGDSATDVNTAKAADIPVIGVPFGYTDIPMKDLEPTRLVEHYRDMRAAIDSIAADFK